jgi:acyl-CoA reductase-like NAD-dependent aldehyde dehydrogenase
VRAELAAESIQDLDLPECRRRTRAPVAGTIANRQCDGTPENSIARTIDLERVVELARGWSTREAEDFEKWLREIAEQLDELGDRAAHVEQGERGKGDFSRCGIRH